MKNDYHIDLKKAFASVPEEAEKTMKSSLTQLQKRRRGYPRRKLALIAALVLVTISLVAFAAFRSQVAELFGNLFGKETQQWIEGGVADPDGKSFTLTSTTFTVDECVYRDNGLYFVGSIKVDADAKVVLLPPDWSKQAPFGYDIYGGGPQVQTAPEGAKSYEQVAAEANKELAVANIGIDKLASQDNALLAPDTYGITIYPTLDGTLRFALEVQDGSLIMPADMYRIQMFCKVGEQSDTWDLTVHPTIEIATEKPAEPVMTGQTEGPETASEQEQKIDESPHVVGTKDAPVVKEEQTPKTMPVYRAKKWEFIDKVNPALFNQSDILKEDRKVECEETFVTITYADGGFLDMSDGRIDYWETAGTWNYGGEDIHGNQHDNFHPKRTVANQVAGLGSWAHFGWLSSREQLPLEKTSLTHLTLEEARAQAEAILKELGIENFINTYAIDLGVDRIHALGEEIKAYERSGKYNTNGPMEYDLATVDDEGFYLYYEKPAFNVEKLQANANFYVTKKGIVQLSVQQNHVAGEVIETPDALVSSESVIARLPKDVASSRFPDTVTEILDANLCYYPIADKEGIKLIPVWKIQYYDSESQGKYEAWAVYDAVTGKLVDAIFK